MDKPNEELKRVAKELAELDWDLMGLHKASCDGTQ
jgi:hypothetical protein